MIRREREIRVQLEIQRLANISRRPHKRQNDPKSPPDSKNNSITPPAAPDGHVSFKVRGLTFNKVVS